MVGHSELVDDGEEVAGTSSETSLCPVTGEYAIDGCDQLEDADVGTVIGTARLGTLMATTGTRGT